MHFFGHIRLHGNVPLQRIYLCMFPPMEKQIHKPTSISKAVDPSHLTIMKYDNIIYCPVNHYEANFCRGLQTCGNDLHRSFYRQSHQSIAQPANQIIGR